MKAHQFSFYLAEKVQNALPGVEAMFADLGHFSKLSIRVLCLFPSVIIMMWLNVDCRRWMNEPFPLVYH